jgi:uncharacterized delta-60 repeat protein
MTKNLLLLILLACFSSLSAQTGPLDLNFGNNGAVITGFKTGSTYANALVLQPDGKILVAGYAYHGGFDYFGNFSVYENSLTITRFTPDGFPDNSFGLNGTALTDFGTSAQGNTVSLQPDGKIVVAGYKVDELTGFPRFAVARFNSNGSIDNTFHSTGQVVTNLGNQNDYANAVSIQTDGKIVVTGNSITSANVNRFSMVRYNSDGSLDTGLAGTGSISNNNNGITGGFTNIIQPDGKILSSVSLKNISNIGFSRFMANGNPDPGFGSNGKAITPVLNPYQDANKSSALQTDGKIVICGYIYDSTNTSRPAVYRMLSNGAADPEFGQNGLAVLSFGFSYVTIKALAMQSDGKILVSGIANAASSTVFLTSRLNANGAPDSTFGINGIVTAGKVSSLSNRVSVAIQPDGKILLAGTTTGESTDAMLLYRLNLDGTLDNTFGVTGFQTAIIGTSHDLISALAIGADGKITAAGASSSNTTLLMSVARYLPDGSPDHDLDQVGFKNIPFNGLDEGTNLGIILSMALQPDGKTVLMGETYQNQFKFGLSRINPDGSLDSTFGTNGKIIYSFGASSEPSAMTLLPNGKIVVTGWNSDTPGHGNVVVAQLNSNGTLDSTFNNNGFLIINFGHNSAAYKVSSQSDGKIVVVGNVNVGGVHQYALARINPDGTLDSSFGTGGKATTSFGSALSAGIQTIAFQPDGKIVAGGYGNNPNLSSFIPSITLARYNPNGSLDATFGNGGTVVTKVDGGVQTYSLALESDGKIVVAGCLSNDVSDFALLRYKSTGTLDSMIGYHGLLLADMGAEDEKSYTLVIQSDGKIVLGGYTTVNRDREFVITRFIGGSGLTLGTLDFTHSANQMLIYPNPFQQTAVVEYTLPESSFVTIELYDLAGRFIKSYVDNAARGAGSQKEAIEVPEGLSAGTYVLMVSTPKGRISVKVMKHT